MRQMHLGIGRLSLRLLETLDYVEIVRRRRRNFLYLHQHLAGIVQPVFSELPPGVCPLTYPIQVENRATVADRLLRQGVEAVPLWSRHHPLLPEGSNPEVDELRRTVLKLPCHQDLTTKELDRVVDCVKSSLTMHLPVVN